jgi:hypothetical protein
MLYQALPADCDLIERARKDKTLGEILPLVPGWIYGGFSWKAGSWPEAENLWKECCELIRRHPGLDRRTCYLERYWDILHYLLSPKRRGAPDTEEGKALDSAVVGDSEIADHVRAGQGVPLRHVAPDKVELAAVVLEPMTADRLREHYNPARMEALGVYKFWADRADESKWRHITEYFAAFRTLYLDAARHGEGVLVCLY